MKRAFDILGASIGLVVFAPLLLAIAIAVRVTVGAPVLFRQRRIGLHGRSFVLLKFRTMRDGVGADGVPRDIKVARSVGLGLDEKAIETVKTWKFDPGTKDGKPVATYATIEVAFHLY